MKGLLDRMRLPFERIAAVDGRAMSWRERRRDTRWWRTLFAMDRPMSLGEYGCALSHISAYRQMREQDVACALVLEDDVRLSDAFPRVLQRAAAFVDVCKPQVVLFSAYAQDADSAPAEGFVANPSSFWCTDAYLITLPAARIIERENYPVVTVADRWKRWAEQGGIELYRAYPTTVMQDNATFKTEVCLPRHRTMGVRLYGRLFSKIGHQLDTWLRERRS